MIASLQRPSRPFAARSFVPHRSMELAGAGAASGAQRVVTVSPSRAEVRRADPSLSFQVVAPGARSFDVIVATDPALFDPANAHRRTPKNFRSSRQDFQGAPIEIETGFYLLPRAFLRDMVSVEPRPTRLYYVAVAYDGTEARQGRYSMPPEAMASAAPHVTIAADLVAANLSKVLGIAVERLGAVNAAGRVMAVEPRPSALPDVIGGLPVIRRSAPPPPPAWHPANGGNGAHASDGTGGGMAAPGHGGAPYPRPGDGGNGAEVRNRDSGAATANGSNGPNVPTGGNGVRPVTGGNGGVHPPPPAPPDAVLPATGGFVDEDYAYGGSSAGPEATGFRDLDADPRIAAFAYDDGYGAAMTEDGGEPIPPLDPVPGSATAPEPAPAAPAPAPRVAPTSGAGLDDVLLQAVIGEGAGGRYDALSLDGGFRGRFGTSDPYYQRAHDGLRLGPHQAMQDTGELGELLALMREADASAFAQTFGPEAEALIAVTTAEGPSGLESPGGRGSRVQPVGGRDLWEEPWVERFRSAARHPAFQAAMRAQIIARRLDPLRPVAEALGLNGDRGIAMLMALAIHRGVEGAAAHAGAAVNPFNTPARLGAALDALGYTDLSAFRTSHGLPPGDMMDGPTHFALIAALRALGPDGPVQVPDPEAVMDALVTAAGPGAVGDALLRLRVSTAFGDRAAAE
jgi:hypothetical protein